jgi:hypothetical protein
MTRNRAERATRTPGRGPLIATAVVLVLGALVLLWAISPTERDRRAAMERIAMGADTAQVRQLLGEPVRCSAGETERIRGFLPVDWPPRAADGVAERLRHDTAQRWVYAIDPRNRLPCVSDERRTEVGIDSTGHVLWYVAVTGRTTIRVPDAYTPSGDAS